MRKKGSLDMRVLKSPGDPKSVLTEADLCAQAAIVGSLRKEWGASLRIVGEEDGSNLTSIAAAGAPTFREKWRSSVLPFNSSGI